MNYYYDLEFLEGKQDKRFFGVKYGETKNTIDPISIGIVSEDSIEYYAISKDFNLKEAWNRYDIEIQTFSGDLRNQYPSGRKQKKYWIRENVLKPIYEELTLKENKITNSLVIINGKRFSEYNFTYSNLKRLLKKYGKTNKEIATEITEFVYGFAVKDYPKENTDKIAPKDIQFFGYYSAYDHVALCWLFGRMIDLPKGFPMYTFDLKQEIDKSKYEDLSNSFIGSELKNHPKYPKQTNEHNALSDARFNKELHEFLNKL